MVIRAIDPIMRKLSALGRTANNAEARLRMTVNVPKRLEEPLYALNNSMTACIGAICSFERQPRIVLASDMRTEDAYLGSETCAKFQGLGNDWIGLMAGNVQRATRLTWLYSAYLKKLSEPISLENVTEVMSNPPLKLITQLKSEVVQREVGLSFEEFNALGPEKLSESVYRSVLRKIKAVKTGCELIIAGFVKGQGCLLYVGQDAVVEWREHYCVSGSGYFEAHSILQQRGYVRTIELVEAIYLAYEAKRWSEKALGVGDKNTVLQVLYPEQSGIGAELVSPSIGIPFLDGLYAKFGLQTPVVHALPSNFFHKMPTKLGQSNPKSTKVDP
jgi:20S proteasome alpha/beta subunit